MKVAKLEKPFANRIVGHGEEDPEQLLSNPFNARLHPDHQQQALAGAIDEVGYIRSVTVNRLSGHVVDGHLRVTLALRSGVKALPVEYVELTDDEEKLALLTLDPIASMAAADKDKLAELLQSVQLDDQRVQQMLIDLATKEGLYREKAGQDMGPKINRGRELAEKYGTALGQIWQLGRHKLAIGDCTDEKLVNALTQRVQCGACVTDPPYGIEREGIINDDPEGLRALYDRCLVNLPMGDGLLIAFQSTRLEWVWLDAARDAKFVPERVLWMYKPNDETFPWHGWLLTSEAIRVMSRGRGEWLDVHPYMHDTYSPTTLGQELSSTQGWHASVKPLAVIEDLIKRIGGNIYDPFVGSGTTLIACERLGRVCLAIELNEIYAAIALQRWQDLTGQIPELVERPL